MENKLELIMFKGLPASGKTTKAKSMEKEGYVRVSKDDIRIELFKGEYKRRDEGKVISHRNLLIKEALSNGQSVISEDCNLNPIHSRALKKIAKEFKAKFIIDDSFIEVELSECISRDNLRDKSVGENVIREMFSKWVIPEKRKAVYNPELSPIYLLDLDGTLTLGPKSRSPYDWHKVGNDNLNDSLAHIIDAINNMPYAKVFIFSGRDEVCRPETIAWLEKNCIDYKLLAMRKSGDNRKDTVVKKEMLEEHVVGKYNVMGVFDDRPSVCNQYFEMGYMTFRVGDPYLYF